MNSPAHPPELESLTQGYLEGSLTTVECAQLRAILDDDPTRVELILTHLQTVALIKEVVGRGDWIVRATMAADPSREKPLPANLIEGIEFASPPHEAGAPPFPAVQRRWRVPVRPAWLLMAASVALLLSLAYLRFGPPEGTPRLAGVADLHATVERSGQELTATNGLALMPGDLLTTMTHGAATVSYGREKSRLVLAANTELRILDWTRGKRLDLRSGQVQARVARQRWLRPMVLATPQAEATVLGTEFTLTAFADGTRLEVNTGRVRFTRVSDGKSEDVRANRYAIAAGSVELRSLPQTGSILEEVWTAIPGGEVNDLLDHPDYPDRPARRGWLSSFETAVIPTNNYACRVIGYVHPPVTGDYTFWIASGGYAALWLSPDEKPANKTRIAASVGGAPQQWDPPNPHPEAKLQMPQSPKTRLVAGRRYFIQAVQKTATGSSHLEVAWSIPGAEREIISGKFLSPYDP